MEEKKKIIFFIIPNGDSFIDDIIRGLSKEYETKKVIVTDWKQIDEGMAWADICWFEWCDQLIIYGSKLEIAKEKKIICRLHSYEALTNNINQVNWDNVDKLIFVAEHIRNNVLSKVSINKDKTIVIPNGVDLDKCNFKDREKGFNIAYVGYINHKKGPMLLLHTFKAIYDKDDRYKLYIAGTFQDERYVLYFQQMIREMGLVNSVFYEGWQKDIDEWLDDKNYILCTSVLESQNMSVMQGMSKGIKPLIHNFVGAKCIYPEKYVWNTIDDAVNMIMSNNYNSDEYRNYIIENYINNQQLDKIKQMITTLLLVHENNTLIIKDEPLVTVGITNYNYSNYLDEAIQSVLKQTYNNIEILVIDDCSSDGSIEKIRRYEEKFENIRGIYHKKNSGSIVLGIQEIIKEAKGKYLMVLSADDYLSTKTAIYEFVSELINNSEVDYVYSNFQIVDKNKNYQNIWKYEQYSNEQVIHDTFHRAGSGVLPITAGVYKTSFYRKNNLTWQDDKENAVAGDTLNCLRYIKYDFKYKHINKPLICYRHHQNNMTYDLKNRIKSIISVLEYIISEFNEEIYLPEIQWDNIKDLKKRQGKKMYVIANHYAKILFYYYNNNFKPWDGSEIDFTQDEIKIFSKPLVLKVKEYLAKCLKYDIKYSLEIQQINQQIDQILKEV
ncbi:glycosyltransferase [Oceanirhabdus sp. W0125-5]|uniref:glycosyltransferase n=1 Tax=Oceanirhabdus sp. W0125-5 TaxID=2999116 RepID=UPI0022F31E41|nr:glycosyltransferase [Oceanirhabdus sp. W0125-5]WBW96610.1 glycosyltransferase [Oceanirhabdus sp. W0125-5]